MQRELDRVGIYFLIRDNIVVYVGKTEVWPKRLHYHVQQDLNFDQVKFLKYNINELDKWERAYIKKYNPEYNSDLKDKKLKRGPKKYTFRVGSKEWKIQTGHMRFRKLTKKSIIGFGKHEFNTVERAMQLNLLDVIKIYYTCSHVTFFEDILDELKIVKSWQIQKPGTDKDKFRLFCDIHYPELVEKRIREYLIKSRRKSKETLKGLAVAYKSRQYNRDLNQKGGY